MKEINLETIRKKLEYAGKKGSDGSVDWEAAKEEMAREVKAAVIARARACKDGDDFGEPICGQLRQDLDGKRWIERCPGCRALMEFAGVTEEMIK